MLKKGRVGKEDKRRRGTGGQRKDTDGWQEEGEPCVGQCILSQSTKLCKAPVPVAMETRKALSCFTVLPTVTVMRLNERLGGGWWGHNFRGIHRTRVLVQLFPDVSWNVHIWATSAAKIFSSWNFEAVRNSLPASCLKHISWITPRNILICSEAWPRVPVNLKQLSHWNKVGGATGFPADISVL